MRVYVASKFENQDEVHEMQKLFTDFKHEITYDWTKNEEPAMIKRDKEYCGMVDFIGVRSSTLLVAIIKPHIKGTLVEIGIAIERGIPIWIVGSDGDFNCIFFNIPVNMKFFKDISEVKKELMSGKY